jgi:hypothetical protein
MIGRTQSLNSTFIACRTSRLGRNLNTAQAISGYKIQGDAKFDHDNSMAKCPFLHQISCRVNQQAQLSLN